MKSLDKQGIAVGNLRTPEESSSLLMMLTEMHSNQPRKTLLSFGIKEFALQLTHPFAYNEKQSLERMVKQVIPVTKPLENKASGISELLQLRTEALKTGLNTPTRESSKAKQGFGPQLTSKETEELVEGFMKEVYKPLLVTEVKSATKSYSGMSFQMYMYGLETSIRTIPAKPIKLKFLSLEGKFIQANLKDRLRDTELGKLMGSKITIFDASLYVDELKTSVGINLQDHYKTILAYAKRMTKMTTSPTKNTFMDTLSDSKGLDGAKGAIPLNTQTQANKGLKWWDRNRLILYGNIQVKFRKLAMDVLTSTSSKMEECLRLSMDTLYLKYNEKLDVYVGDILLSRLVDSSNQKNSGETLEIKLDQTSILKIPQVEATFKYNWVTPAKASDPTKIASESLFMLWLQKKEINYNELTASKLKIQVNVNIPSKSGYQEEPLTIINEGIQQAIERSPVPIFHYQSELFSSLIELPQLSNEYLRSKGIRVMNFDAVSNQTKQKTQAPAVIPKSDKSAQDIPGSPVPTLQREDSKVSAPVTPRGSATRRSTLKPKEHIPDDGSLKNILDSVKIGPEFASYINLISVTLDEQLNMATQKNLLSILDDVEFKINTSHLRILMTNLQKTDNLKVKAHKDDPNLYSLRGIQAVVRSLNYTTEFYKSQTNIRKEVFRRLFHSEGEKLLQWATRNGQGRIQTMYASFFDCTHLLSLQPKNLEKIRKAGYKQSLESPEAFKKFFGLESASFKTQHHQSVAQMTRSSELDVNHINHLFNIKAAQEFFPFFMKKSFELRQMREEEKRNKDLEKQLPLKHTISGGSVTISVELDQTNEPTGGLPKSIFAGIFKKNNTTDEDKQKAKESESSKSGLSNNFEFSPVGGIFKAYDISYNQNSLQSEPIVMIDKQDNFKSQSNSFNHFVNISSSKLLVGENLSKIGSLLILEPLGALQKKIKGGSNKQSLSKNRTGYMNAGSKYSPSGTLNEDMRRNVGSITNTEQVKPSNISVYSFGVKIKNPQINFFREDRGTQVLFTSNTGMLFFHMQEFLPFDFNQADPKQAFYLNCNEMGIYSAPPSIDCQQQILWIEDNQYSNYQIHPSQRLYRTVESPGSKRVDFHSLSEPVLSQESSVSKQNVQSCNSQPSKPRGEGTEWKTGVLNKLVTSEKMMVFELLKFKNAQTNNDFSQKQAIILPEPSTYWSGDPRYLSIRIIFDSFKSKLNGQDFDLLLELPKMFVNMVAKQDTKQPDSSSFYKRDQRTTNGEPPGTTTPTNEADAAPKPQEKEVSPEMVQLRLHGKEVIAEHLKRQLTQRSQLSKDAYTTQSHIQFIFKDIMVTMTSLDSVPHLKMEVKYLTFKAKIVGSAYNSYQVGVQNIQISPCPEMRQRDQAMTPPNEQLKPDEMILKPIHRPSDKFLGSAGCNQVFYLEQNIYNINIETLKNPEPEGESAVKPIWKAVNNLEIRADPFMINLNYEIIKFLQEYMFIRELNKIYKHLENKENIEPRLYIENNGEYFRKKEQAIRIAKAEIKAEQDKEKVKIADEEANILPTYYNLVKFNQMKLVITNKTTNILQQLEKMRLTVETFEIREQFLTRRALLDKVLKYMLSAAFTRVLKYKVSCFGGSNSDEDEQGAAEKEESRKLQILMG